MKRACAALILTAASLLPEFAAQARVRTDGSPEARLVGLDPQGVRARLGAPAVERREGRGALWTFKSPTCALLVFFRDEKGLKVYGLEAGPRLRGGPDPDLGACLRSFSETTPSSPEGATPPGAVP